MSGLSHIDSTTQNQRPVGLLSLRRHTKEDYVDVCSIELLCEDFAGIATSIIGIVNNNLPTTVEEIPDELFATLRNLIPQRDGLGAFLSCYSCLDRCTYTQT